MRREDRRVQRTRQALQGALLSLIREKGFEALTVQDIIDRANLGRATFYAHFDNKEDLLVSGMEEFRTSLRDLQRRLLKEAGGRAPDRAFLFSHELFAHASEHRDVFRAMLGSHGGVVVQRLFQKILVELVREEVKAAVGPRGGTGACPTEAAVQYIAAGLWGLVSWWADSKMRVSVDEMDAMFRRLAIPALKAAPG